MIEAGPSQLLRAVRTLELVARKNVAGLLAGDYTTSILGRGLVFHEPRKYVVGEPARHIDWNITARLDEPYVKVHREERQREVFLALDVSPSMHTGLSSKTKLEQAVELAATLAVSAIEAGDRAGLVVFADRVLSLERPRGGKAQLFRLLRLLLDSTEPWRRKIELSDPRSALHAIQQQRGRGFVVLLISDFIDHDIPDDLRYVQARHDVSILHIYDPLEYRDPESEAVPLHARSPVRIAARSPEGSRAEPSLHLGAVESLAEMKRFLRQNAGRHRIAVESISTREPVPGALQRFFHRRRRLFR